jgi:hypothetical protein
METDKRGAYPPWIDMPGTNDDWREIAEKVIIRKKVITEEVIKFLDRAVDASALDHLLEVSNDDDCNG